mmetsp:Transcript_46829/g.124591  ORF Transcript_46829/g.124591 Transcript_46829/m.124591 type:complete len:651 (-) Transcript_46829:158-2110(-)|eukprot:CAMPEP_0113674676 /NCGR_PEP_ID=MMETSP0038_2-20120614/7563_1 /TAXON_ID=2898 /ORGANISM="Cryptomonas paramecium" /LENGTH=650 /DNA_ID=CAMNT_0000591307 /DNA_START=27 /DNA_END=1979 /DNA_ORIENTATION=+ /assembly_acc=CAM_ASM_000170
MFEVRGEPLWEGIKKNAGAGITVALVNIPLSISLAVASDATPSMGCITVIWAGAITAFLGGSHYNVVGPTGALSGLLSIASVTYGQDALPLLAIMAGLLSFVVFFTNMDKLALFVPANTMQGFTIAVAIIISFNQLNFALGLDKVPRHPSFVENVIENLNHAGAAEWQAIVMFLAFGLGQFNLGKLYPRIPWAIVMACIGIALGYLSSIPGVMSYKIRTLDSRYPGLSLSLFSIPTFRAELFMPQTFYALFMNSLSIAFVAILETLISAKIADRMTKTKFNQRQEVFALSLANCASGFFGGIPATAALARTALNIKSGATSRLAGIIGSIAVVILSMVFLPYFKFLPLPNIAAILCNVAYRMIEFDEIVHIYANKKHFMIMICVAVTCVFVEPTSGIIVGILLSLGKGAFIEAKAWVFCKLRQGEKVLASFYCDLEIEEKIFETLPSPPALESVLKQCLGTPKSNKGLDQGLQEHVFTPSQKSSPEDAERRQYALNPSSAGSRASAGDPRYHLVLEYKMAGTLTCITASTHVRRFEEAAVDRVLLNLSRVTRIDVDGLAALEDLVANLEKKNKRAYICGLHRGIEGPISRANFYEWMVDEKRILRSYKEDQHVFLCEVGPSGVSEQERELQRYVLDLHLQPDAEHSAERI